MGYFKPSTSINKLVTNVKDDQIEPSPIFDGFLMFHCKCFTVKFRFSEKCCPDNSFAPFDQLALKFSILNLQFFRFLQLRSFVSNSIENFPIQPPGSLLNSILKLKASLTGKINFLLNAQNLESLNT